MPSRTRVHLLDIPANEVHSLAKDFWEFAGTKLPRIVEDDLAELDSG